MELAPWLHLLRWCYGIISGSLVIRYVLMSCLLRVQACFAEGHSGLLAKSSMHLQRDRSPVRMRAGQ
jgi:hypothetical protein